MTETLEWVFQALCGALNGQGGDSERQRLSAYADEVVRRDECSMLATLRTRKAVAQ